ncbi:MAG: Ig-like domain-containing protein, partial [Planctomycetota bacterium]
GRRLLTFTGTAFDLPAVYDFSFEKNGVEDVDGENTGFPIVQGNDLGDELQPGLIDLDRATGVLRLTTRGDATNGSNFQDDNTLANGLQLPVNTLATEWLVHTRVVADQLPLTQYDAAFEQAGLLVGPSQDNYAKLVFGHDGSGPNVQWLVELNDGSGFSFPLTTNGAKSFVSGVQGVNLATANYVDLWISGDPNTGVLSAQYRVQGGQTVRFTETVTLTGDAFNRFFRTDGRAGILAAHKNNGDALTASFDSFGVTEEGLPATVPTVRDVRPGDADTDVDRDAFVAVDLTLPNAGINGATVNTSNLRLVRVSDGATIDASVNTTGGGDAIVLTPTNILDAETTYRFEIDASVEDNFGNAIEPFTSTFTTGFGLASTASGVAFDQIALPASDGHIYTGLEVGPDGKLYASDLFGDIFRWDIEPDGTLSNVQVITTITDFEGGDRITTGITFAPDATASDLALYVVHTGDSDILSSNPSSPGDDFTGKLTRLTGDDLELHADLVTGLPRSTRDHLTNQPVFGPDGLLYVPQGANTAMGAPDPAWGNRPERLLTSAVLTIDVDQIEAGTGAVNVRTTDAGGTYDPFAVGAPVQLFATGVRNAYDLVWHSNGNLYAPTNGSAAGGNTPASPQPTDSEFGDDRIDLALNGPFSGDFVPALNGVSETQNDYLYKLEEGGYYGSPNPIRDEWVLNGGNPDTSDTAV